MKMFIVLFMSFATVLYAGDKHPTLRENLKCITDSTGDRKHIDPEYIYNANRVVLYFGASWCGACKEFYQTRLLPYYDSLDAVVLYVSLDDDQKNTYKYMRKSKMPWNVVMPGTGCVDAMKRLYKVGNTIPEMASIDSMDNVISKGDAWHSLGKLKSYIKEQNDNAVAIDSIRSRMRILGIPESVINELIKRSK